MATPAVPAEENEFGDVFQAAYIPKQKAIPDALSETKMVTVSVYPPVGQVSQLQHGNVRFDALLQVHESLKDEPWEMAIWYSGGQAGAGGEWAEAALSRSEQGQTPSSLQPAGESVSKLYFTSVVPVENTMSFTVKFRQSSSEDWRWIRDEQNLADGTLIVDGKTALETTSEDLPDLISGLNPDLTWKAHASQCPGTRLWSIEAPVGAVENDESKYADLPLGLPWGGFLRYVLI
jgi:hypothetical protein